MTTGWTTAGVAIPSTIVPACSRASSSVSPITSSTTEPSEIGSKPDQLGIYGDTFGLDATDLPCSEDDPDGSLGWDDIEDEPYYGYGLLTAVDCATDLPGSAVVCQRKQHPETKTLEYLSGLLSSRILYTRT
ncbi:MAG: hypothetical protein ABEH88_07590 [Halobacteriales archaeon]